MQKTLTKIITLLVSATILTGCTFDLSLKPSSGDSNSSSHTAINTSSEEELPSLEEYYKDITLDLSNGVNGELRNALGELARPKQVPTYSGDGSGFTLSRTLQDADEDPDDPRHMIFFYSQESKVKGYSSGGTYWNREHVWPKSLSRGAWSGRDMDDAGADLLHLRPTYEETNETRGNSPYGEVSGSYYTLDNGTPYGRSDGYYFEPIDSVKGDCARIIMYVWTVWDPYYYANLTITDVFESIYIMLKWHLNDEPSQIEINRNNYAQRSKQKNRNPFVDHPEYACRIWGNTNSQTRSLCGIF